MPVLKNARHEKAALAFSGGKDVTDYKPTDP